jgi:LytS/YehU family sensor histidine kinase
MNGRNGLFVLYSVYTILGALFLEMMVALLTFLVMAEFRVDNMSPASVDIFFLLASFLVIVFLGVAIKMVSLWRQSKNDYRQLALEKIDMELKFLKAQLNPHFLFNTLNNLYYLTTEKSDKAPQAILQLSEILDYVLHSNSSMFVPLGKELRQVENYIALELLRYEERVQVSTQFTGDLAMYEIGPMILITLIENAFKHGVMPSSGKSWLHLHVEAKESELYIGISNSSSHTKSGRKIGLTNLRNQLDHLYGSNYSMEVISSESTFSVNLIVNRKNEI